MVFAVQASVGFRNVARRDTVMGNVQTRLAQNVPWGETVLKPYTSMTGDASLSITVRFFTKAEQDSFWADVQAAFGSGLNGPVSGSRMWRHDCPHDEGGGSCEVGEEVLF